VKEIKASTKLNWNIFQTLRKITYSLTSRSSSWKSKLAARKLFQHLSLVTSKCRRWISPTSKCWWKGKSFSKTWTANYRPTHHSRGTI